MSIYRTTQLKDKNEFFTDGYINDDICNTITNYYFNYLNHPLIKVYNMHYLTVKIIIFNT